MLVDSMMEQGVSPVEWWSGRRSLATRGLTHRVLCFLPNLLPSGSSKRNTPNYISWPALISLPFPKRYHPLHCFGLITIDLTVHYCTLLYNRFSGMLRTLDPDLRSQQKFIRVVVRKKWKW